MDPTPETEIGPLIFRGRLTEDDVADIRRCLARLFMPVRVGRLLALTAACIVATGAGLLYSGILTSSDLKPGAYFLMGIGLYLEVWVSWLSPTFQVWLARRAYRRKSSMFLESQVTLCADRLGIENDAVKSDFRWELVKFVADTPRGVLFCNALRQSIFWLPNRVFEDADSRAQLLKLAERNRVQVRQVR